VGVAVDVGEAEKGNMGMGGGDYEREHEGGDG